MTSYHDAAVDLARELASLVLTHASARMTDSLSPAFADAPLHVALRARAQVLTLARTITADVIRPPLAPNTLYPHKADKAAAAAAMPSTLAGHSAVTNLLDALRAHPDVPLRFPERDPAPLLAHPAAASWEKVAHHALVAGAAYPRTPGARTQAQQWAAVADVAAITGAVTVLDGELAHAVNRLPNNTLHVGAWRALQAAATSPHLALAAAAASAAASAHDHAPYATASVDLQPRSVIAVTTPADLARAQRKLRSLVTTAEHLSPASTAAVLTGQARLAAAAATVLAETDPSRARTARAAATALTHVAATAKDSASVHPDTPGPGAQNRSLAAFLAHYRSTWRADPAAAATAMSAALEAMPAVVRATALQARRMVDQGAWLQRALLSPQAGAERAYAWQPHQPGAAPPTLSVRLDLLDHRLSATATQAAAFPAPPLRPPAREVLAPALRAQPVRAPGHTHGTGFSR